MRFDLVIFDCDGVLVESELITNQVFVDMLVALGADVTLDDMFERFVGHSMAHCLALSRDLIGRELPTDFVDTYRARTTTDLEKALLPVPDITFALDAITCPTCVASSGDHQKMRTTLGLTGLLPRFDGRLYSVTQVSQGKPAPDVFLFAAKEMGVEPARVAVIEDTPVGVTAGRAAGMTVFGYAGRTPEKRLRDAGASVVFTSMRDLPPLLAST